MNTRHPEPASVIHYRATINAPVPQVCTTCDNYRPDGICAEFGQAPPEAFANEPGGCALWELEIPF
jgi:hypothetical protein